MYKRGSRLSPPRGQQGLASIVVVSVLIVIMTLITIGFTRLVNRSAVNSANRQFSASATYAAQSGINDVASYLKKYAINNPGSTLLPKSTTCTGNGSLIGNSSSKGPFYDKSQLSTAAGTQYTCLLLNPTPNSLVFTQVQNLKSQVVKINTSASAGALDKILVSWQPSNSQITGYPVSSSNLNDETTWNSSTGICKDSGGVDASCIPMLRIAIFPVSNGEALTAPQAQSKTIFLYPQGSGVTVPAKAYGSIADGSLIPIPCTQNIGGSANFNPTTNTGYKCNVIINSLASAIAPSNTDTVYMRITPIYNQADVRLAVNDKFGNSLNFINDQAIVDVTAQTAGVVKRLQARVDTSSLVNGAGGVDTNISSNANTIPEQSVRSANALCKREIVTTPSLSGFPPFINFDTPDAVCHDLSSTTVINNPVPTLAFSIIGNDGTDNGKRVCSSGDAPETSSWGCVTANNPDSPQNPVQQGTVYINSGATLDWNTTEATTCTASGGWSGNPLTSVSGPNHVGSGNQPIGGITVVTEYDLVCSRPGAPATTPTKKVFAWPPPQITGLSSTPARAGQNYTVTWSSINAKPNGCVLSGGNWSNPADTNNNDSETMNWPVNDNSTDRAFTVTCYDPIGRSDTRTIHDNPAGGDTGGGGSTVAPPTCSASVTTSGNNTNNATISWSTSCPDWDPSNICQPSRDIEPSPSMSGFPGYFQGIGSPCWQPSGSIRITSGGTYTLTASVWATPWATQGDANSTGCSTNCDGAARDSKTITVYPPLTITNFSNSGVWDQGPECMYPNPLSPYHAYDRTWWCRAGRFPTGNTNPGCADGVHRWTTCSVNWSTSGGAGTVNCTANVIGYGNFDSSSWAAGGINSHGSGPWGWIDAWLVTGYMYLNCSDSIGQTASWGPI